MPTTFRCPCGQVFQVNTGQPGQYVRCPRCSQTLKLRAAAASQAAPPPPQPSPPPPLAAPQRPARPAPAPQPAPQTLIMPPPRRRPEPRNRLPWVVSAVAGVVLVAGTVAAFVATRSGPTASDSTTPAVALNGGQPTTSLTPTRPASTPTTSERTPPTASTRPATVPTGRQPDPPRPDPTPMHPVTVVSAPGGASRLVDQLNAWRTAAGLGLVALDDDLSKGCQAHAGYLARHAGNPRVNPSDQESGLDGFSEEGRRAARAALVLNHEPAAALRACLDSAGRRPLLLDPDLQRLGVGSAAGGGETFTVLDLTRGRSARGPAVVVYPVDGQKDVPMAFPGREVPDPIPEAKGGVGGYPITVTIPKGRKVTAASGVIKGPGGKELPAWFSSPEKPANPAYPNHQGNCLCLIAREPFEPETTYAVELEARIDGTPWRHSLSFTTMSQARPPDGAVDAFLERLNGWRRQAGLSPVRLDDSLTRDCQAHAYYLARNAEANVNQNDEDPKLPGYTPQGRRVAQQAHISLTSFDPILVSDSWASLFHYRFPVLDPQAVRTGVGLARSARFWHVVVAHERGGAFTEPLLFPGPDQADVPCFYAGSEGPPLLPRQHRSAAFPVTVQFPERQRVSDVTAELFKQGAEKPLPVFLTTPQKPVETGYQKNTICLLGEAPFEAGTAYEVRVKARVDGRPWNRTWTFRTAPDTPESQRGGGLEAVAELNRHRKLLGFAPVALDPEMSPACAAHARYLHTNFGHPSLQGLGMHDEQPSLPGYSAEGRRAGKESVIAMGSSPASSIEAWVNTFYHRIPLLEPDLASVGVGYAQGTNPRWYVVLNTSNERSRDRLVVWPPDGGEVPTQQGTAGYPLTVTVHSRQALRQGTLRLTDAAGAEVPCDVVKADNTLAVTPRAPLKAGQQYTLGGKVEGAAGRTWAVRSTFRTSR